MLSRYLSAAALPFALILGAQVASAEDQVSPQGTGAAPKAIISATTIVSRSPFETQGNLNCDRNGVCTATLYAVASSHQLDVSNVTCHFLTAGTAMRAYLIVQSSNNRLPVNWVGTDLGLTWQRSVVISRSITDQDYNFGRSTQLLVPAGWQVVATITNSGAPAVSGHCSIFGFLDLVR